MSAVTAIPAASVTAPAVIDGTSVSSERWRTRLSRIANSAAPTSAYAIPIAGRAPGGRARSASASPPPTIRQRAGEDAEARALAEDHDGDHDGEQRRHAERHRRTRRARLTDPERDEELRDARRDGAREHERQDPAERHPTLDRHRDGENDETRPPA